MFTPIELESLQNFFNSNEFAKLCVLLENDIYINEDKILSKREVDQTDKESAYKLSLERIALKNIIHRVDGLIKAYNNNSEDNSEN